MIVSISGCGDNGSDITGNSCLPKYIYRMGDSLAYNYDVNKRLTSIVTYHVKKISAREDYSYNSSFDDHPVLWADSKELATLNVYVHRHPSQQKQRAERKIVLPGL
jgi:hypothetical protein